MCVEHVHIYTYSNIQRGLILPVCGAHSTLNDVVEAHALVLN